MATYTPYVDMAVEIGNLFSQVKEANSFTDSDPWEWSTVGINGTVISCVIGVIAYLWKQMKKVRHQNFLAMEMRQMENNIEDQNPPGRI